MFSCCERNSQNSDTLHSHFVTISLFLGNTEREPTDKSMFRHWGRVPYLHVRHPQQGWGHPQASRQRGSSVPGEAGATSGFCVLLQALGGVPSRPPILDSSLPGNCLPGFKRSIISFFSWLCICGIVSAPFFHYLHADVLWINLVEPKSSPPPFRIPHRTWTKEIAEMKKRRDGAYSKVEQT